jgi:hypothetical protein
MYPKHSIQNIALQLIKPIMIPQDLQQPISVQNTTAFVRAIENNLFITFLFCGSPPFLSKLIIPEINIGPKICVTNNKK